MHILITVLVCFFAGMGAGLGTGFAGMSAAAVISPMLITFLGMDPYLAVGIALSSDVLASAVSAYTYGKNKNLDIRNGLIMMASVLAFTVVGSYIASIVPSATMGSFSVVMTFLLGVKFIVRPVMTTKEAMQSVSAKKRAVQSVVCGVIIGFMLLCFALVNLIGTWVITARAKAKAKRPKDAATMIAMRRILDNPKRAWRNVSGIALAVFIAGITSICGFFGSAAVVDDANDPFTVFIRDIGTGGILTLVFAAVLAAVSSGVMQAGSVYDQAGEYRMLVLEGTDVKTLNRARFIEVLTPLNIVVIVAGGCSMLLMAPLFAASMTEPATLASFFGLCCAMRWFPSARSRPIMWRPA